MVAFSSDESGASLNSLVNEFTAPEITHLSTNMQMICYEHLFYFNHIVFDFFICTLGIPGFGFLKKKKKKVLIDSCW